MGGRKGGREEGGREGDATLNSLGSGWFRFREWFVFAFALDGWSVGGSRLVCLAGLVWSGWSGWLYSRLREELLLVLFCLFVCSFRAVYSIQYSFCLVFALLILTRDWRH